jgi:hypothetical protein
VATVAAVAVGAAVDTVVSAAVVSVDMPAASVVAALAGEASAREALALEASATASRTQRREAVSGRFKATVLPVAISVTASAAAASTMAEASIEASSPAAGDPATTMITGITRTMPTTIPTMTMAAAMSCNAVCILGTDGALGRFKSAADGSRACGKEQLRFIHQVNADFFYIVALANLSPDRRPRSPRGLSGLPNYKVRAPSTVDGNWRHMGGVHAPATFLGVVREPVGPSCPRGVDAPVLDPALAEAVARPSESFSSG